MSVPGPGPADHAGHPAAAWFPDPWDPSHWRWWDGAQWTADQVLAHAPERPWGAWTLMSGQGFGAEVLYKFRGAARGEDPVPQAVEAPWPSKISNIAWVAWVAGAALGLGVAVRGDASADTVRVLMVLAALVMGALAFRALRRWSRLADLPTSAPVAAHVGMCELAGELAGPPKLQRSWLADRECLWWAAAAEHASDRDWSTNLAQSAAVSPVVLCDDEGGEVLVDLLEWSTYLANCAVVFRSSDKPVRCTEYVLVPGANVTLVGDVSVSVDGHLQVRPVAGSSAAPGRPDTAERDAHRSAALAVLGVGVALATASLGLGLPLVASAATVVVAALVGWAWWVHTRLVAVRERIAGSWAVIETFAQRRHDLVPELAAVAAGAAAHERTVQVAAAEVPSAAATAGVDALLSGDDQAATSVRAVAESNPVLRADAAFATLFRELAHCEAQLAGARTTYNEAVRIAADRRETFPTSLLARGVLGEVPPYLRWGVR